MNKGRILSARINAVLNVIKTISSVIFPLITFPYVSRVLTVESIGAYNFSASIVSYCSLLAGLGISTYAIREGTQYRGDKSNIEKFTSEVFSINLVSTILSYIVLFGCIAFVPKIHNYALIVSILGTEILFTTIGVNWLCNIYEDFLYVTIRTIAFQFLSLIATFVFVRSPNDILRYVIIVVCASSGANLMNFFYIRKNYVKFHFRFVPEMKKHIKPIIIIFFTTITITLYVSSDVTILGFLSDDRQVGLYSASVKIYTIIKNLLVAVVAVLIPRFSLLFAIGGGEKASKLFSKVFKTITVLVFPMTVGLFMTSTDVITLVAGIKYTDAGTSLAILSIATMFSMFAYMYTNCVIIPLKKEKVTLYASILSAIVNVGLNFLLIPILGINAAAITTVIAEAIMCVISIIYSRKIVTLKNVGKCVITTVISCVLIVLMCLIHSEIENLIIRITVKVISSVILYFVSMRLMKNEIIMEYLDMFKDKIYKLRRNKI